MATPSSAIQAVFASGLAAVSVYSRGGKKIVRMVQALQNVRQRYGKN
jgi:hypothetical protein